MELRRLADEFEMPLPVVDPALQEEVRRRRAAPAQPVEAPLVGLFEPPLSGSLANRRMLRITVIVAVVLALFGVALLVVGQPIPGGAALLVGVTLSAISVSASRRRVPTATTQQPRSEPATPVVDVELQRLEARLLLEEEAGAQAVRRRDGALARISGLKLPLDPPELRQLASRHDAATFELERCVEWDRRRGELVDGVAAAGQKLRAILVARGTEVADQDDLDEAFQRYVEACRRRAPGRSGSATSRPRSSATATSCRRGRV